ncbi:dephospho-CoA kinase [Piscinibacter sp.]|uniref:dephospho-CoA kinase n=1 Tax=Piscinibacter sp. TaxID=1903157 RepID=UPI002BCA9259|nr:dephospho-CoA kinase [Albitalea sp.]HUG24576.1 dephospho-CoA kinase [Albitalea sp.]
MLRIGLTGGIGSGKSTVAGLLAAHGAAVIDTDAIARQLTLSGGAAIDAIRSAFGDDFIDAAGALDRERMRALAFAEPEAKRRLEDILHPLIGAETARQAAASHAAIQVFDVPLLIESGRWRAQVDRVLVVDCSEATQIERVVRRAGWSPEMARAVIAQQAARAARLASADAVIHNDGITLAQLGAKVDALWAHWHRKR